VLIEINIHTVLYCVKKMSMKGVHILFRASG
jgi:hypothetical protein